MEYIKKEELTEGEIYHVQDGDFWMIGLVTKSNNGDNGHYSFRGNATFISKELKFEKDQSWCYKANRRTYRLATPEEKHWLESCITVDKFITFEEAMKTFIPEYVEWIDNISSGNLGYQTKDHFKKNKIFKTDVELPSHGFQTQNWIKHLEIYPNNYKPSTKEAYDAQFIVKEPAENKTELEIWLENTKSLNLSLEDLEKYIGSGQTCNFDNIYIKLEGNLSKGRAKILFDKWNEKVIEPLPQFKVIESIETITKVENNEGNQFFIGDIVISDSGFVQTIKSFRYNVNKDNVLATTNVCNQISIARLEHYIEPKVEETLLEKAKRLYPIGTKFKSATSKRIFTIKNHIQEPCQNPNTIVFGTNEINADNKFYACVHSHIREWAEIIE